MVNLIVFVNYDQNLHRGQYLTQKWLGAEEKAWFLMNKDIHIEIGIVWIFFPPHNYIFNVQNMAIGAVVQTPPPQGTSTTNIHLQIT